MIYLVRVEANKDVNDFEMVVVSGVTTMAGAEKKAIASAKKSSRTIREQGGFCQSAEIKQWLIAP